MVQYSLVRYKTRQETSFHFLIGITTIKMNLNTKGYFTIAHDSNMENC